ncbi:MAG: hypothetical protein HIU92_13470 [Proteobacteria bacterium]|nr:hypothetical protein [Pseudomonadota bacterium]
MSTTKRHTEDEPDVPAAKADAPQQAITPEGRFDWQVLLLRYLPEPRGSSHVVKRLAPR